MAILALVGAVGYGADWVPHVIVPDLYSGITKKVWNYLCFTLYTNRKYLENLMALNMLSITYQLLNQFLFHHKSKHKLL